MERMKVPVRVSPILKEFLIDTTGSDTITPKKGDIVWSILKQHLETAPEPYPIHLDTQNYIYIEMLECSSNINYCNQANRFIYINTLFRWHLSERGQNRIRSILSKNFKSTLHNFMMGALACNPELQQREAMEEFCDLHNLTMSKITPDMIKKSWDRSDHKKKIHNAAIHLNSLFF